MGPHLWPEHPGKRGSSRNPVTSGCWIVCNEALCSDVDSDCPAGSWSRICINRRRVRVLLLQTCTCVQSEPRKWNMGNAGLQDSAPCESRSKAPASLEPEGFLHRPASVWSLQDQTPHP